MTLHSNLARPTPATDRLERHSMNQHVRTPFDQIPPATQAGILCNDPRFQKFAAMRCGLIDKQFTATAAAEYLRDCCNISSRADLNTSAAANQTFQTLRTEFDAWTGRIARQQ